MLHIIYQRCPANFFHADLKIIILDKYVKCAEALAFGGCFFFRLFNEQAGLCLSDHLLFSLCLFQCLGLHFVRHVLLAIFPFQKSFAGDRIDRVNDFIIQVRGKPLDIFLGLFQFRLQHFSRPACDRLFSPRVAFEGFFLDFGINGNRSLSVQAVAQVFDLGGEHLVPLILVIKKHIVDGLDADNLAGGRDQRNLAQFLSDSGKFLIYLVNLIQSIHLPELVDQVREHSARGLMEKYVDVNDGHLCVIQKMPVFRHHLFFKDFVDLCEMLNIKAGVPVRPDQSHHQRLNGRVGGAVRIR